MIERQVQRLQRQTCVLACSFTQLLRTVSGEVTMRQLQRVNGLCNGGGQNGTQYCECIAGQCSVAQHQRYSVLTSHVTMTEETAQCNSKTTE